MPGPPCSRLRESWPWEFGGLREFGRPTYFKYALGLPAAAHAPLIAPGGGGIPPAPPSPLRGCCQHRPARPARGAAEAGQPALCPGPSCKSPLLRKPALNFGKLPFFSPSRRFSSVTQAASCGGRGCLHVSVGRNSVFGGQGKACVSTFDCGKTNVI